MGVFARCALVVLVCAGATRAGLRRLAPTDSPLLRALFRSERTEDLLFNYDWASFATDADLLAPDGRLTDDEIIALLLSTWGRERVTRPAESVSSDARDEAADALDDSQLAPRNPADEDMSGIVLDGLLGDGAVDDDSPFVTWSELGFDELELVTHDEDEDITQRVMGAGGAMNTSAGKWGGHGMAVTTHGARRFDMTAAKPSQLGMVPSGYFLDWPWSARSGRNMFYWLVGPPAMVFFVVGVMGVVSEMANRSR